jgi:hypothetical protein
VEKDPVDGIRNLHLTWQGIFSIDLTLGQRGCPLSAFATSMFLRPLARHCRSHDGMYPQSPRWSPKTLWMRNPRSFALPGSSKIIQPLNWRGTPRRKIVVPQIVDELDVLQLERYAENRYTRGFCSPDRRGDVRTSRCGLLTTALIPFIHLSMYSVERGTLVAVPRTFEPFVRKRARGVDGERGCRRLT